MRKDDSTSLTIEEQNLLLEWNTTKKAFPLTKCLHELIEEQVRQNPLQPAVRFEAAAIDFAELNERANQCARYLRSLGTGPDSIVGVLMERSIEMVIALLGILKAGGAYLPLDPTYPEERLMFMVEDAGVSLILTQKKYQDLMGQFEGTAFCLDNERDYLAQLSGANLERITTPEQLAYVIYTSGSTGKPKGCMVPHQAICNRLLWMQDEYRLSSRDRVLQKTPFTFDVSVWEFFWPLLTGACLVMAKPEGHKDSNYLVELIRQERITTAHFVPSMLRFFLSHSNAGQCDSLRQVFTSGEALPYELMREFMNKLPAKLHNLYGPTEAAVDVTYWACEERTDQKVPIGRPISNIQIYILDSELRQVPVGYEGELHIGGIGLAKGYLNRAELTAQKFIDNPFFSADGSAKLYKTGDKARFLPDGNIEYLGRMDFQVKLRGNRIELGEIEAVLREHPAIEEAVVLVKDTEKSDPKLVAYLVTKGEPPTLKAVRRFVKSKLPDYMAPNVVALLNTLPVTQHGKLNRAALPWPIQEGKAEHPKLTEAQQPGHVRENIATVLLEYFRRILAAKELNAADDVFDLGATSLTMMQAVEMIHQRYGVSVPVEVFLTEPNLGSIADFVAQNIADQGAVSKEPFSNEADASQERGNQPAILKAVRDFEKVIDLPKVAFKETVYPQEVILKNYQEEAISFKVFSRLLALLKSATFNGEPKYLYPSAGGLNAVQTYLYIKENAVTGIQKGFYYYHPQEHALYRITDGPAMERNLFFEDDRPLFDRAGFVFFLVAQLEAIQPVYQETSSALVTLDAGYLGQLLVSRQLDFNLGLYPVATLDFERIQGNFQLDSNQRFIHCICGGVADNVSASVKLAQPAKGSAGYLERMALCMCEHTSEPKGSGSFASFLKVGRSSTLKGQNFLTKEEHDAFHAKQPHLRRFLAKAVSVPLESAHFPEVQYQLRACQREYLPQPVALRQLSKFLNLLKPENHGGKPCYLYPSVSAVYPIRAYLYIKENGVAGLNEGIYYYHPDQHALMLVTAKLSKRVKTSYTPFNRKQYQNAAFCLFLFGQLGALQPIYDGESNYFALLEAGYLGQLLMDHQAEFELGLCPIGGLDFERIRSDFRLEEGEVLLHSFTCGSFAQPLPQDWKYLEAGRADPPVGPKLETGTAVKQKRKAKRQDLAIAGISGRYPGATSIEHYWENLKAGKSTIGALSESRKHLWRQNRSGISGDDTLPRGGFLEEIDCFDSLLFNIAPPEARSMDPQERLCMEVVWECLENAGYTGESLNRSAAKVGVFIGAMWTDYQNHSSNLSGKQANASTVAFHSSIANRISYFFNFRGPSVALNTSCSSALTAIHFACESIKSGECDAAIVGGINLLTHAYHQDLLTGLDMLAKEGQCHPLGALATGWLPGEGVGVILIKPLEAAELERDYIYGVIKGTAIGHSGRTVRFGAPSAAMQAETLQRVMADAEIAPESIDYIELAAAGASIADATEIAAVKQVFQAGGNAAPLWIGSVKANLGHLESAAAMSQLTKVLLQMQHRQLVPTIDFKPISPLIQIQEGKIEVVDRVIPWIARQPKGDHATAQQGSARRALINAFGATGSGGHLIVEEYGGSENPVSNFAQLSLIPLAAASQEQLHQVAARLLAFLSEHGPRIQLSDIAYTLQTGRVELEERLAVLAETVESLQEKLAMVLNGEERIPGIYRGTAVAEHGSPVIRNQRDLTLLAAKWVKGARIDWKTLHDGRERKIPLPTYPFAKVRHWVLTDSSETAGVSGLMVEPAQGAASLTVNSPEQRSSAPGVSHLFTEIEVYLQEMVANAAELPAAQINKMAALEKYGINSLMIARLNRNLEQDFGALPKTLFFEYQTIHELAEYFWQEHQARAKVLFKEGGALENTPRKADCASRIALQPESIAAADALLGSGANRPVDIAIIGLSGRYPASQTLADFWENLKHGTDCITEIPKERWDYQKFATPGTAIAKKPCSKWGGFIADVDQFDPLFFNIAPCDAEKIDPQERLFLETVWHTFEDAGYNRRSLQKAYHGKVGIYVGVMYAEYQLYGNHQVPMAALYGSIANRVSYHFDFHGPSMAIDTMCSSSLTALHLAVESIKNGECEAAIAGGVNLSIHPNKYLIHAELTMSATDGRCRSFGEGGDGFVPGEGVGAVLLKPLSRAMADGDPIYGVIKATAVNHGGKTNGYMVPNPNAQCALIEAALQKAAVDPRTISYVEAHGTGTALGDPIEIAGMAKSFAKYSAEKQYCPIGSVKSNIGHLEAAAGIAALTKVLLQMKHKQLVPSLHSKRLNPNIDFAATPFFVQQELCNWEQPVIERNGAATPYPRRAAISSFGAGGANACTVIEEYEAVSREAEQPERNVKLIVLSAKTEAQLREAARRLLNWLQRQADPAVNLADLAYTLQVGREAMEERLAMMVGALEELQEKLKGFIANHASVKGLYRGQAKDAQGALAVLGADEEMQETIEKWIQRGKYANLLDLWVGGLSIDWDLLYAEQLPRRISLPPYPFARERYWAPENELIKGRESSAAALTEPTESANRVQRISCFHAKQWQSCEANATVITPRTIVILTTPATAKLAAQLAQQFSRSKIWVIDVGTLQMHQAEPEWQNVDGWIDLTGCASENQVSMDYLAWVQQLIERGPKEAGLLLLYVTKGLESFQNTTVCLSGASRVGLYRMLQSEYSHLRSRHLDLEAAWDEGALARQIAAEFFRDSEDVEICYRDGRRYRAVLTEVEIQHHSQESCGFPEGHVLWITGGTRGLGYLCAEHFVKRYGVKQLVLTGREHWPPREQWASYQAESSLGQKIRAVQALEAQGVQVTVLSVELTDPDALRQSLKTIKATQGPIGGIIHCAGTMDRSNPAFIRKSIAGMQQVLNPKTVGLDVLYQSLQGEPLQFFVLFSSVAAHIPALASGQSDYAMANAYMDYFAAAHQPGSPLVSIAWPNWKETGMGEVKSRVYEQSGLLSHTDAEGLQLLDQILAGKLGPVVVPAVVDPKIWRPTALMQRKLSSGALVGQVRPAITAAPTFDGNTLLNATQAWLKALFANELKINPAQLDLATSFQDYGMNSILLAQVITKMEHDLKTVAIEPSSLLEYATLGSLAVYLTQTCQAALAVWLASEETNHGGNIPTSSNQPQSTTVLPRAEGSRAPEVKARNYQEKIAVIGMACHFPDAANIEQYWENLKLGRDSIREVPKSRWDWETYYDAQGNQEGKSISKWGAFLDGIEEFDPNYFKIPESLAVQMDPLQRQWLEVSAEALADAGYEPKALWGKRVGVFAGARTGNFAAKLKGIGKDRIAGTGQNFIAVHLAHIYNFRGPNMVVDAACASSLAAIHLAVRSLQYGEAEVALAGGVDILLDEAIFVGLSGGGVLSPDGRCKTFDAKANGIGLGEGCGVLVLKPLSKAIADHDQIYGVIDGSAVNSDGNTMGITTPNPEAQQELMHTAIADAQIQPETISYVETHGTGTLIGDPIELKALTAIFSKYTAKKQFCGVGSVKSNLGHLLSAAGVAGMIKVLLAINRRELPPTLHCGTPNPRFNFHDSPLYPVQNLTQWSHENRVLRAGISAFGLGGNNAHIIVSNEGIPTTHHASLQPKGQRIIFNRKRYWPEESKGSEVNDQADDAEFIKLFEITEV